MDETSLYIHLQGVVERSGGAVLWSDVCLALKRAQEAKVREQLGSMFSEMDLQTLSQAHAIAERETLKPAPLPPTVSSTQPAAKLAPTLPTSKKAKR